MKLKKVISLLLTMIMMFNAPMDVSALVLNMTSGKNDVIQVETGTDQFFNVIFQEEEWEPNAEQVYTMYMGLRYDMWRHSGDQDTSKDGDQPWKTTWGILSDAEMQELMEGQNADAIITLNGQLPQGVKNFLNNGGSWEDIKVTFQCEDIDGNEFKADKIFLNGAVDGWIKWGTEVQLTFRPYFRGSNDLISNITSMQVKRGLYPYSHTMFSIFTKTSRPRDAKHLGAAMVTDKEHGEKNATPGYEQLYFDHILNTSGDLKGGFQIQNIEYGTNASSKDSIDTSTSRIGDGGTFNSGGAIGISFNFPVKITFEINPNQTQTGNGHNLMYVSEYSIVNMADDADPDEMTTHASMQAYSNREQ